jgi:hypothetical protein
LLVFKQIKKNQNLQKRKKVEGPILRPNNILPINSCLQHTPKRGDFEHLGGEKLKKGRGAGLKKRKITRKP